MTERFVDNAGRELRQGDKVEYPTEEGILIGTVAKVTSRCAQVKETGLWYGPDALSKVER